MRPEEEKVRTVLRDHMMSATKIDVDPVQGMVRVELVAGYSDGQATTLARALSNELPTTYGVIVERIGPERRR